MSETGKFFRRRYRSLAIALLASSGLVGCSDRNDNVDPVSARRDLVNSRVALSKFATDFQHRFVSLYVSMEGSGKFTYCYRPAGGYSYTVDLSMDDSYKTHSFRGDIIHQVIEYFEDHEWAVTEVWGPNGSVDNNAWRLVGARNELATFELNNPKKTSVSHLKIVGKCFKGPSGSVDLLKHVDSFSGVSPSNSPKATPAE